MSITTYGIYFISFFLLTISFYAIIKKIDPRRIKMESKAVDIREALGAFFATSPKVCRPFGNGHINDTFFVEADKKYVLQRINTAIFTDPDGLMGNIAAVTEHIRKRSGGEARTLAVLPTLDGKSFFRDSNGLCFRVFEYVEGSVSYDTVGSADDFYRCGEAFGAFQGLLSDFPAGELCEVIRDFHNTPVRYEALMLAAEADVCSRYSQVAGEVEFVRQRKEFCHVLEDAHRAGELPLRVTHNDTKLNNILFDERTGAPICVIDLDTVMPGFSVNDFGDSIRFGASTAAEDEADLSKVSLDLGLFEAYVRGFLKGCEGRLAETEIALLPVGAIMMTLECGMRFLTDYLQGDVYFKTRYPTHNLDRARNQLALVADMEAKLSEMNRIVEVTKEGFVAF